MKGTDLAETTRTHPDLPSEQAYIEAAYGRLETIREEATARADARAAQRESSFQGTYERDVAVRVALERARSLDVGDESLCFGRTDADDGVRLYIGRRAVFDASHEPMVVDWRVPAAEPFYRATGKHPLGLIQRRHFLCEGRRLLAIEDERFDGSDLGLAGHDVLFAAMERPRTGHMRDIVATVQAEQDEIIRDQLEGVLAVQGGPGTGKTAVALHRAAFLLFTHRRKLERQGMLVVGPTRRFLRYIEQVLPALGEGGVDLATLHDLAPAVTVAAEEPHAAARVKGDARMAMVVARAVRDRQAATPKTLRLTLDDVPLTMRAGEIGKLVAAARRNRRTHNARRSMLLSILVERLYRRYVTATKQSQGAVGRISRREGYAMLRADGSLAAALDAVWPMLTPQALIGDLLTARERLASAAHDILDDDEIASLLRADPDAWTAADIPLLDEAAALLGAPVVRRRVVSRDDDVDEIPAFGHVIVDEAQDLSPMAFRMIARRSLTGSVTLVGDLAQSFGATTPHSWDEILALLPQRAGVRVRELTINYRTPGSIMDVAARILADAAPGLVPPDSARPGGEPIEIREGDVASLVAALADEHRARGEGTMVVIGAHADLDALSVAARTRPGDDTVVVLSVEEAKGLEFDRVVIAEPARLVATSPQGLRALYVALTRATHHVALAHAEALPAMLQLSD